MRVQLRPTVAEDLPFLLGHQTLPHRIKATTALVDGRIVGIGGLGFRPDGTVIAFVMMNDHARRYPVAIHRAGLHTIKMMRDMKLSRVVAQADPDNPAAGPWLQRLGFRATTIRGETVWVWQNRGD